MDKDINTALRIIDANLNRAREGLRVCEEIIRFLLEDKPLMERYKSLRHRISDFIKNSGIETDRLLLHRDSAADTGKNTDIPKNTEKEHFKNIYAANIQRTKEALRVLEEFTKSFDIGPKDYFKDIRFEVYELEKETFTKFSSSICNS